MNWKILFLCVAFGPVPMAVASAPSWFQLPAAEARLQSSQTVGDSRHYAEPEEKVVIGTGGAPVELVFEKGTKIANTVFEVGAGGRLVIRDAALYRVGLICQPGGEIQLENCALMQGYLSGNASFNGSTVPAPRVMITDSVLSHSTLESPVTMGLTTKSCRIIISDLHATQQDGTNTASSYNASILSQCNLLAGEVLLCSSKCWFSQCEYAGTFTQDFASYLPKPVLVQVAWSGRSPESLPQKADMAHFQFIDGASVYPAGTKSGGPELLSTAPPSQRLAEVLRLADANGKPIIATPAVAMTTSAPGDAPMPPTVVAQGLTFKSRISSANGLLIQKLSSGEEAGMVTKMSLTALPSLGSAPSVLKFNQYVGDDMQKALSEVSKFTQIRHGGLPGGHAVEVGFEDKYVAKDGPSAAVACALLLEAAITGKKWDPAFAVTGDMNADGSVQPIGGVQAKIRGATKGACKLVGVPVKNEKAVQDVLVLEGPAPLVGITVFGIKSFEEALLLADPERPQALQNALTDFDKMRTVMMRDPRQIVPLLRTPHAAQRLQALLAAAPNCYSAKYLLLYVQGRGPRTLSIGGSIEAAQGSADAIVSSIDHDVDTNMSSLKGDELGSSLNRLRTLRPLLDARVWPYVDNLVTYGEVIRGALLNPVRSGARYVDLVSKANKAAGGAKSAYEKLINDAQVREELGL
jgi:hypothetical protein